jgi:hypothetical protein
MADGRINDACIYLGTATGPDQFANVNEVLPRYKPGELGHKVKDSQGRVWQVVDHDTGATSAVASGIVAVGDLAFVKDVDAYLVTNDPAQAGAANAAGLAVDARNFVVGVYTNAVTAGRGTLILLEDRTADGYAVNAAGSTWNIGDTAVANTGTNSDVARVAAGTAPSSVQVGVVVGALAGGLIPLKLTLPGI